MEITVQKELYLITNKNGYMNYYEDVEWLEYYLNTSLGGLRDMEVVETCKRSINGIQREIVKLGYAHCGYVKSTYRIELVKFDDVFY